MIFSLIGAGDELVELVEGEIGGLAAGDHGALLGLDFEGAIVDVIDDLFGDEGGAVFVAVEEVPGVDEEAEDFDGAAELFEVGVAVGDVEAGGEEVEAEGFHLVDVADGAVGEEALGAEGAVDIGVDLAPVGAAGDGAQVLDDGDFGAGGVLGVSPVVFAVDVARAGGGLIGMDGGGAGEADHGPEFGEDAVDAGSGVGEFAGKHLEGFDGVGYGAGIEATEGEGVHFFVPMKRKSPKAR